MSEIIKNGGGKKSAIPGAPSFEIDIEALERDAKAITLVAQTYGIKDQDIEHLKQAVFYCTIGSGLVPDSFMGNYREIFLMSIRAKDMGCSLSEVLQGGYFVHGRWGWYAEFMIKRAIGTGFFTLIDYEVGGKLEDQTLVVRAFGVLPDGTKIYGSLTGIKMAIKEGWTKNSKYDSMPLYMLKKRAATFLIREACPHVFGGVTRTGDEIEDIAAAAHRGTVIDSPSPEATTPQEITNAAIKEKENSELSEMQKLVDDKINELLDRENRAPEAIAGLEAHLKMKLEQVKKLPPNALLSLFNVLQGL